MVSELSLPIITNSRSAALQYQAQLEEPKLHLPRRTMLRQSVSESSAVQTILLGISMHMVTLLARIALTMLFILATTSTKTRLEYQEWTNAPWCQLEKLSRYMITVQDLLSIGLTGTCWRLMQNMLSSQFGYVICERNM